MKWIEPRPVSIPDDLKARIGGHPLVAETLVRRGIATVDEALAFLDPEAYTPASPFELPGMRQAMERLLHAIERGQRICVWGDFDVDGQTSTALLVETLQDLGASVSYHIPLRETESHGITLPALQEVLKQGIDVLLTCDTGVSEHDPIAHATAQGVTVIVTNHHTLPAQLPDARAVVNPQMLDAQHPLHTLPGVGVAYKLAEALYAKRGIPAAAENLLDLVALGIVADVAVQRADTRYLLQLGLTALRQTQRLGLQVLMKTADVEPAWLDEGHIGFAIGPRLNALGRLADANAAVELLTTNDVQRAQMIATQLEGLNARRKLMCDQVFAAAISQIDQNPSLLDDAALVLAHPAWPPGVIGIVASRLVEHFNRPTVLIANPPGQVARGSARSLEGCNITEAIASQAPLLESFGGHPMAAGVVLDPVHIAAFRRGLCHTIRATDGVSAQASLRLDGFLKLSEISMDLIAQLQRLAPFGAGNPPLTLVSLDLSLGNPRKIGRSQEHRQLIVKDKAGNAQQVVWWRGSQRPLPKGRFDLAYTLRASNFQGRRGVQIEWLDARPIEGSGAGPQAVLRTTDVLDYRQASAALHQLRALQEKVSLQIWSEGRPHHNLLGRSRDELSAAAALAVWTIPPAPDTLVRALEAVRPEKVFLFAENPGMDTPDAFLTRLAGLLKFALNQRQGSAQLARLLAATAQTEAAVRAGVACLVAKGLFRVGWEAQTLHVEPGSGQIQPGLTEANDRLKGLLSESAAYRQHYLTADKARLIAFYDDPPDASNTSASNSG